MSRAPIMQRHEVVAEAGEHRRDEEEDHRQAVHREELVVLPRARAARSSGRASCARMSDRLDARRDEEDGRGDEVADADALVVDGREPRDEPPSAPPTSARSRSDVGVAITAGSPGRRGAPELSAREVGARHLVAGLEVLRVEDPAGEVARRVRQRGRRASERRLARCVRSGPIVAARVRAGDRVAVHARRAEEHLLAALELGRRRRRGGLRPRATASASNVGPRLGDDEERHVRVLQPAELGALPAEDARRGRPRASTRFVWPGIMSIFRLSSGTQKLWIDVARSTPRR